MVALITAFDCMADCVVGGYANKGKLSTKLEEIMYGLIHYFKFWNKLHIKFQAK